MGEPNTFAADLTDAKSDPESSKEKNCEICSKGIGHYGVKCGSYYHSMHRKRFEEITKILNWKYKNCSSKFSSATETCTDIEELIMK